MKIKEILKHILIPGIMEGLALSLFVMFNMFFLIAVMVATDKEVLEISGYVDEIREYSNNDNLCRDIYITLENGEDIVIKERNTFSDICIGKQIDIKQIDTYILYICVNTKYRIL